MIFGKKNAKAEKSQPSATDEKQSVVSFQQTAISSGRMSAFYQKLYIWVFSVNVSRDVYQIESGTNNLSGREMPIRGYYHALLKDISQGLVDEHRESFLSSFSTENIIKAFRAEKTCVCACFCAQSYEQDADNELSWYEYRAEWPALSDKNNMVVVFSVRGIKGDMDNGQLPSEESGVFYGEDGALDMERTRAALLRDGSGCMDFDYDVKNDVFILHRQTQNSKGDRVINKFLSSLAAQSDFIFSRESISEIKALLDPKIEGIHKAVIACRAGGTLGAEFHHYKATAAVTEIDGNTWILGSMYDAEQQISQTQSNADISKAVSSILDLSGVKMFYINMEQKSIIRIAQGETGFHRKGKPMPLAEYIQKRISSGRISPESQTEYLRWLENGYLQKKTLHGPYEFEARVKDMEDVDFQWYSEKIIAVTGKPSQFVRWQSNDTAAHEMREIENENIHLAKIGEYNHRMLDTLANLIEFRSVESGEHIARVRLLTGILLEDVRKRCPSMELTRQKIEMYAQAATMHDIGKICIPDYILNKEQRYTPQEYEIMKKHTTQGAAIIDRIDMPGWEELKETIRDVVLHHHERFDGKGYPEGLAGDQISIGVQAVGLADVYDALVSVRCYKESYSADEAVRMIMDGRCGVFNPTLLETLKACSARLQEVYSGENK